MRAPGLILAAALVAGIASPALRAQPAAEAAPEMSVAEVRRIDRDAGRVTLRHGEIRNLDMPPMTMVFQVTDPVLLEGVQVGDQVLFTAVHEGGQYKVTALQPRLAR